MPTERHPGERPYEPPGKLLRALTAVYVATAGTYVVWRYGTLNPDAPVFSWLVYGAELFGIATMLLLIFMTWRLTKPRPPAPPNGLKVDVLIPSYNEPVEVVRRTLLAATRMGYPHQTWLLDDGNRPQMRALANRMGCGYLARPRNIDAKAGNLNTALGHSTADFLAVFDADHAPHPHFLRETLGYFRDRNVAFVQTPQDFYNLDSYQHRTSRRTRRLWTEQSLFFNVIQRGKDYWNAAFFCGSCAVLRRSALDAIGGFATGSVTEDLHTSLRLHEKGYASVYHPQSLAFGIAVLDADAFMRQRLRWGQGAMQVWRQEKVLFNSNLTLAQRLNYLSSIATYFDGWQRAIFYTMPAFALVSGKLPIKLTASEFLAFFVPYLIITFWTFAEVTRGHGHTLYSEQYNFARFAVFCQSTLAFFRRRLEFMVTGKTRRQGGTNMAALHPQLAVLCMNALAIPIGIYLYLRGGHLALDALVANTFWSGVVIAVGLLLLRFTSINGAQRRREYRFPIPACAAVTLDGQTEKLVTVDNLSPAGFGSYGGLPGPVEKGKRITGRLHLPGGPMPFHARIRAVRRVRSGVDDFIRAIGCEFDSLPEDAVSRLEAFLHGNDLQWQFLDVSGHARTMPGLPEGNRMPTPAPESARVRYWTCCTYIYPVQLDLRQSHGVISASAADRTGDRHLLVMRPLIYGGTILVRPETYGGQGVIAGNVARESRFATADGPVYLYRLQDCKGTTAWVSESIPA